MNEYRIVIGADRQHIEFTAPNDQVALEFARKHIGRDGVEAWSLERVVVKPKPAVT